MTAGDILSGSVDGGSNWTNITSMVTTTAINWTGATLSGASSIVFKVTDSAGNDSSLTGSTSYTLDNTAPTLNALAYTTGNGNHKLSGSITTAENTVVVSSWVDINNSGATFQAGTDTAFADLTTTISGTFVSQSLASVTGWGNTARTIYATATDLAGNVSGQVSKSTNWPAGIAGESINLGLSHLSIAPLSPITLNISGVPSGWILSEGNNNGDGSWTVQTDNPAGLTVTSPVTFTGALVLDVLQTWTNADGSSGSAFISNNVEVYAPGSPIFAISADDNLSGSTGADTFVFAQPMGNNKVFNFNASMDKIDLIGFSGINGYTDLTITDDGYGNALIANGSGQSITLMGVLTEDLGATNFIFNVEPSMYNTGTLIISDGAIMPFGGTIYNTGTIILDSSGTETELEVLIRSVTLQGGGTIVMSDNAYNIIFGGSEDAILVNLDNTISGAGQLGAGQMTLANAGVISANGVNALRINTGTNKVLNTGTLQSVGTGGLQVISDLINTGLIWANGGNVVIDGDASGAGIAMISGMATLEFSAASDQHVSFTTIGDGMLILANAAAFTGSIDGFNAGDRIDLVDINFGANDTLTYVANDAGTGGLLSVSDGLHTAQLEIDGQYIAAGLQSDGAGGSELAYGIAATNTTMLGGSANDLLTGGAGNDSLQGGIGNDTLTGGFGADVFKWSLSDQGTEGNSANDIVKDFSIAQGDSLDLRDLLTGEHDGSTGGLANNLTSYLYFEKSSSGTDTIISISTSGDFKNGFDSTKVDQTITLEHVVVDVIGNATQQQMIDDLMKQQVIKVDL